MTGQPWVNFFLKAADGRFLDPEGEENPPRAVALQSLYDYWLSKLQPGEAWPARSAIDPVDLRAILPHLLMVDVRAEPLDFFYRVVGGHVVEHAGRSMQGKWLSELRTSDNPRDQVLQAMLYKIGEAVIGTGAPVWVDLEYHTIVTGAFKHIQAVCLPLYDQNPNEVEKIIISALYEDTQERRFDPSRRA